MRRGKPDPLREELAMLGGLEAKVRRRLYNIESAGGRARAATMIAAAAADRAHRIAEDMPSVRNQTSEAWRGHLEAVWLFLSGDARQHYTVSAAVADFLTSPLNHNEGQDGPDDFDRPQTVASYFAALCVLQGAVDFATIAVAQIFELIDIRADGAYDADRTAAVRREIERVNAWLTQVDIVEQRPAGDAIAADVIAHLRSSS